MTRFRDSLSRLKSGIVIWMVAAPTQCLSVFAILSLVGSGLGAVEFKSEVLPIIEARCLDCHDTATLL